MSIIKCKWLWKGQNFVFYLSQLRKYKQCLEIRGWTESEHFQIPDKREDTHPLAETLQMLLWVVTRDVSECVSTVEVLVILRQHKERKWYWLSRLQQLNFRIQCQPDPCMETQSHHFSFWTWLCSVCPVPAGTTDQKIMQVEEMAQPSPSTSRRMFRWHDFLRPVCLSEELEGSVGKMRELWSFKHWHCWWYFCLLDVILSMGHLPLQAWRPHLKKQKLMVWVRSLDEVYGKFTYLSECMQY